MVISVAAAHLPQHKASTQVHGLAASLHRHHRDRHCSPRVAAAAVAAGIAEEEERLGQEIISTINPIIIIKDTEVCLATCGVLRAN